MNKPALDAGIPVLTEIIDPTHPNSSALGGGDEPVSPNRLRQNERTAPPEARSINGWVDAEWSRLERQISERVLQQLMGRVDFVLEQRVRDSLADVLQTAVEGLAAELRQGLQQTLEEVIARAVSQEISRAQSNRK